MGEVGHSFFCRSMRDICIIELLTVHTIWKALTHTHTQSHTQTHRTQPKHTHMQSEVRLHSLRHTECVEWKSLLFLSLNKNVIIVWTAWNSRKNMPIFFV